VKARLALLVLGLAVLAGGAAAGTPKPVVEPARGGQCVAPPEVMRREHPDMLKHQRDVTVRQGVRGAKVSLEQCVDCHASRADNSVAANKQDFCASCHAYAGVKLDCFECHTSKAKEAAR
jgi:hypothetical protein